MQNRSSHRKCTVGECNALGMIGFEFYCTPHMGAEMCLTARHRQSTTHVDALDSSPVCLLDILFAGGQTVCLKFVVSTTSIDDLGSLQS